MIPDFSGPPMTTTPFELLVPDDRTLARRRLPETLYSLRAGAPHLQGPRRKELALMPTNRRFSLRSKLHTAGEQPQRRADVVRETDLSQLALRSRQPEVGGMDAYARRKDSRPDSPPCATTWSGCDSPGNRLCHSSHNLDTSRMSRNSLWTGRHRMSHRSPPDPALP